MKGKYRMTIAVLENGTKVKTVLQKEENTAKNWVPEALTSRKWDTLGVVVKTNDEHGLCYGVRHDDGSAGWYDRNELEVQDDAGLSDST